MKVFQNVMKFSSCKPQEKFCPLYIKKLIYVEVREYFDYTYSIKDFIGIFQIIQSYLEFRTSILYL